MLFVGIFLLLSISFYSFKEDVLAPSVIVCFMWLFSTLCAVYNIDNWKIDLHINTVATILYGLILFIFGEKIGRLLPILKNKNTNNKNTNNKYINIYNQERNILVINISLTVFVVIIAIGAITVIWQYKWVLNQTGGLSNWTDTMEKYRMENSSWSLDKIAKPSLLANFETILKSSAFFMTYVFFNNIQTGKKNGYQLFYLIPGILYCIDKILNAGRGDVLMYLGAVIFAVYICAQKRHRWRIKVSHKFVKYLTVVFFILLFLFSSSRTIVGRKSESSTIEYITMYAGGSVQLFDMYLQKPEPSSTIWGKETFQTLVNYLGRKFGKVEWQYIPHLEFRYSNGVNVGNVYGAFRYYIYDFGYIGLTVLTVLDGIIYSYAYKYIRKEKYIPKDGVDWKVLIYMYFASALFMFSIADYTYAMIFNIIPNFKVFIIMWIIKRLLVNRSFGVSVKGIDI